MEAAALDSGPAVGATPAALEVIARLEAAHGPLAFFQSGGCCDGTSAICLKDGELPMGPHDLRLGEIGGAPFYIDADQYERWGEPRFLIDVAPGGAAGFSLEGLLDMHFISCAPRRTRRDAEPKDGERQTELVVDRGKSRVRTAGMLVAGRRSWPRTVFGGSDRKPGWRAEQGSPARSGPFGLA